MDEYCEALRLKRKGSGESKMPNRQYRFAHVVPAVWLPVFGIDKPSKVEDPHKR